MGLDRGVLYVATGDQSNAEVLRSVRSLRTLHPSLPITLFTDREQGTDAFDEVRRIAAPRFNWSDKIAPLLETPYEHTLFLDSDTHVCDSLDPLFELLDRFELAVAHDTWRGRGQFTPDVPTSFAELNTGVLAYQLTPAVRDLITNWVVRFDEMRAEHHDDPNLNDQAPFRRLLWEGTVRFVVVPAEYNFRIWSPNALGLHSRVAILHSHAADLDRVAPLVNRSAEARAVIPTLGYVQPTNLVVLTPRGDGIIRWLGRLWPLLRRGTRRFARRTP